MKTKLFLICLSLGALAFAIAPALVSYSQPPEPKGLTIQAEDDTTVAGSPVASTSPTPIPDTICVTLDGERICVPTGDAATLVAVLKEVKDENKGNLPTNMMGWVTLIMGILFSAKGTQLITSGKRIYAFLKIFLRKTLHVVAFVAAIASAIVTYLLGKIGDAGFDWQTFTMIWGVASYLAVYIYDTWVKPKEATNSIS